MPRRKIRALILLSLGTTNQISRVCNVVLKSESYWDAHQRLVKHHEAINNLKASVAGIQRDSNVKSESSIVTKIAEQPRRFDASAKSSKPQAASGLPPNFFDKS